MGANDQNSTLSEHGQVAYQIKKNQECSNMVATILPADPPPPPDPVEGIYRSIYNFFTTWSFACQIKENQECSNMLASILPVDIPSDPWDGVI